MTVRFIVPSSSWFGLTASQHNLGVAVHQNLLVDLRGREESLRFFQGTGADRRHGCLSSRECIAGFIRSSQAIQADRLDKQAVGLGTGPACSRSAERSEALVEPAKLKLQVCDRPVAPLLLL